MNKQHNPLNRQNPSIYPLVLKSLDSDTDRGVANLNLEDISNKYTT